MKEDILELLASISFKSRILREWQKTTRIRDDDFTERELLAMELICDYPPLTEKSLTKFFGLSFSSVAGIVKHLRKLEVIEPHEKTRGKPLRLTRSGLARLKEIRKLNAERYSYLLDGMNEPQIQALTSIYNKMDENAERHVQKLMFGAKG